VGDSPGDRTLGFEQPRGGGERQEREQGQDSLHRTVLRSRRKTARVASDGMTEGGNGWYRELRSLAALADPNLGRGGVVKGRHPDLSHVAPLDGPKGTTGQVSRSSSLTPSRRTRSARAARLSVAPGSGRSLRASNRDGHAHVARSHQRASTPGSGHGF